MKPSRMVRAWKQVFKSWGLPTVAFGYAMDENNASLVSDEMQAALTRPQLKSRPVK